MEPAAPLALIDAWLDRDIRVDLEERLWRPIGDQATLEVMLDDPAFLADPGHHPAMFADHGIVHARDVALGVIRLEDVMDGMLLPGRPPARRAFVTALGVATAYLHDTGMVDMTRSGRRLHGDPGGPGRVRARRRRARAAPASNPGRSASGWTRSTPRRRSPSRSSSWSASC